MFYTHQTNIFVVFNTSYIIIRISCHLRRLNLFSLNKYWRSTAEKSWRKYNEEYQDVHKTRHGLKYSYSRTKCTGIPRMHFEVFLRWIQNKRDNWNESWPMLPYIYNTKNNFSPPPPSGVKTIYPPNIALHSTLTKIWCQFTAAKNCKQNLSWYTYNLTYKQTGWTKRQNLFTLSLLIKQKYNSYKVIDPGNSPLGAWTFFVEPRLETMD